MCVSFSLLRAGCGALCLHKKRIMAVKEYTLKLTGRVGEGIFSADYVEYVLDSHKGQPVEIKISSYGGDGHSAIRISEAFAEHGNVSVHYSGGNASAATIVSLGAKHVSIDRGGSYLVHKGMYLVADVDYFNADNFRDKVKEYLDAADELDRFDKVIAGMYASRCKKTPEELLELMTTGGWLTAQEALEWGFVDEITDYLEDPAVPPTEDIVAEMEAAGTPVPQNLLGERPRQSFIDRICAAIENRFRREPEPQPEVTVRESSLLCGVLNTESIVMRDGTASLSDADIDAIESRLQFLTDQGNERQNRITELESEIAALKEGVPAPSPRIIETPAPTADSYMETLKNARKANKFLKH